jgi:hypothetical protein
MKRKFKGKLPIWAKPIVWGNAPLARILWINLYAGLLLMFIAVMILWQLIAGLQNIQQILALMALFLVGLYFSLASVLLIIQGYGEE